VTEGPQAAVLVSSVPVVNAPPCTDIQEPNNDAGSAYGNLIGGSSVTGGICTAGDVDYFRFQVTKAGPVSVTITTRDTPLRATLTGTGISRTQDIPANSTATLNADAASVPNDVTLRIEASGALGLIPSYVFTPQFSIENGNRRRGVRH
jgi:hypothetical protein